MSWTKHTLSFYQREKEPSCFWYSLVCPTRNGMANVPSPKISSRFVFLFFSTKKKGVLRFSELVLLLLIDAIGAALYVTNQHRCFLSKKNQHRTGVFSWTFKLADKTSRVVWCERKILFECWLIIQASRVCFSRKKNANGALLQGLQEGDKQVARNMAAVAEWWLMRVNREQRPVGLAEKGGTAHSPTAHTHIPAASGFGRKILASFLGQSWPPERI